MSTNRYFIFKTSHAVPTFIGRDFKPGADRQKGELYGIPIGDSKPKGTVLHTGVDTDGNELYIIGSSASIETLKDFHDNYSDFTSGVGLTMAPPGSFSKCVKNVIDAYTSGKPASKPASKPAAKKSAKKPSKASKSSMKGGSKKRSKKRTKGGKKKSSKKHSKKSR